MMKFQAWHRTSAILVLIVGLLGAVSVWILCHTVFSDSASDPMAILSAEPKQIRICALGEDTENASVTMQVGEHKQLDVLFTPFGTHSGITWHSSDPSVVSVGAHGYLTAHAAGTAVIDAETGQGIRASCMVAVSAVDDPLTYALLEDGSGYTVVGCREDVCTVHIPSFHEGLPVTAVDGLAFVNCSRLSSFTVEEDHPVFYCEDGVLFSDTPEKTLVRFPICYDRANCYIVPDDTVHIAPYAFAGLTDSERSPFASVTIPDGVCSLGDGAFAYVKIQVSIFVPDSLTVIGDNLTRFAQANIPFYVSGVGSPFASYARRNNLPCGTIRPNSSWKTSSEPSGLDPRAFHEEQPLAYAGEICYVSCEVECDLSMYARYELPYTYDFSELQKTHDGEIRWMLYPYWSAAIPDENGNTEQPYIEQTGLYGAGYTEEPAILRGYDLDGQLIAMQKVSGDFVFAFPGAYLIGLEGGGSTQITALPVEPVFLSDICTYPIIPDAWNRTSGGDICRYFIVCQPYVSVAFTNTDERIWMDCKRYDAVNPALTSAVSSHYQILFMYTWNSAYADCLENSNIRFDSMQTLYEDDDIAVMKNSAISVSSDFAEQVNAAWDTVKRCMNASYLTEIPEDYRLYFLLNDQYPFTDGNVISVNSTVYRSYASGQKTIYHEMVHAADLSIEAQQGDLCPVVWFEGRAEYIGEQLMRLSDPEYRAYADTYNWSFLSEEERADFFTYYYYSTNRYTTYSVGYYFVRYLCTVYGEDIMQKICSRVAAADLSVLDGDSDSGAELFKSCITSVTDENVFQNFVRDVIEQ